MNRTRWTGLALVWVECALLGWLHDVPMECAILAVAAFAGVWNRWHLPLHREHLLTVCLVLAALFGAYRVAYLQELPSRNLALSENLSLTLALYCLTVQVLLFFVRAYPDLRAVFVLLGVLVVAFCSDVTPQDIPRSRALRFSVAAAYVGLVLLFLNSRIPRRDPRLHPARVTWLAVTLAGALTLAWFTMDAIHHVERNAVSWLTPNAARLMDTRLGTAETVNLSSVNRLRNTDDNRVALRIYSEEAPGYLRGGVYTNYEDGLWKRFPEGDRIAPDGNVSHDDTALPGANTFVVSSAVSPDASMHVWPDSRIEHSLYLPGSTATVSLRADRLQRRDGHTLRSATPLEGRPYRITFDRSHDTFPVEPARPRQSAPPEDLHPEIMALAQRLTALHTSTRDKAQAVAGYLTATHAYALDTNIPLNLDPLEFFLLSDPPAAAHCEFFATAATILLRAAGVPTRYVTGVVSYEQNEWGNFWVARNRDAHAWCEAYDTASGSWFLVEATPANGLPTLTDEPVTRLDQFLDQLRLIWARLRELLRTATWSLYGAATATTAGLILLAAAIVIVTRWALRRRRRQVKGAPYGGPALDPDRATVAQCGERLDRIALRLGVPRRPSEGPSAFACRLRQAVPELPPELAATYVAFARLRYGKTLSKADCEQLTRDVATLQTNLRRRP